MTPSERSRHNRLLSLQEKWAAAQNHRHAIEETLFWETDQQMRNFWENKLREARDDEEQAHRDYTNAAYRDRVITLGV